MSGRFCALPCTPSRATVAARSWPRGVVTVIVALHEKPLYHARREATRQASRTRRQNTTSKYSVFLMHWCIYVDALVHLSNGYSFVLVLGE